MTTTPAAAAPARAAAGSRPFRYGRLAITAVIAAVANTLVFAVGSAAGASMSIDSPAYSQITLVMSAVATLLPLLVAGGATWLVARRFPASAGSPSGSASRSRCCR
ncbi:hypothetical protein GCM10025862_12250 [Arsenicicoccus piscis]|uniref:Major facilitator superfamily (MFS) profile domain-containing protein n=1 Tax=Arsenicicoccus piscis TaxID=673954 RepID=A0ABQ6HP24_9MICO|nr:hypothetical protein GCM10025862_12250 [Arsenicicoccus piscis]